jgi:hypothetical protein
MFPNYASRTGASQHRRRRYVQYDCDHRGLLFSGRTPPARCDECGRRPARVWEAERCGGCAQILLFELGDSLDEECAGNGRGHVPAPVRVLSREREGR